MLNQVRPLHIRRGAPEQDSRIRLTVQLPQPLADRISVRLDPTRSPTRANSFSRSHHLYQQIFSESKMGPSTQVRL